VTSTVPAPTDSFGAMSEFFEEAVARRPDTVSAHSYVAAGHGVRLRIAGRRFAREVTPSLAHLLSSGPAPARALSIDMWDQEETGVTATITGDRGGEEAFSFLTASADDRFVAEERNVTMSWLDRHACRIVGCAASAGGLYVDQRARPFTRLMSIWLNDRGVQLVHSGLVAWQGRGVLFVGMSGAGKSTSSIACLRGGFDYLGDDFVGLEEAPDGTHTGHGIYASCLLTPAHLARFPDLAAHALAPHHAHEDKSLVYLSRLFPDRMERRVAIAVVALPRVVDSDETTFRPASKVEALLALAPTSVMFLPGATPRALDKLGRLVERVPCYWLELGRDVDRIPDTVRAMVEIAGAT